MFVEPDLVLLIQNFVEHIAMTEATTDIAGSQAVIRPENHHPLRPAVPIGILPRITRLQVPRMFHLPSIDIEPGVDLKLAFAVHCVLGDSWSCEEWAGRCIPVCGLDETSPLVLTPEICTLPARGTIALGPTQASTHAYGGGTSALVPLSETGHDNETGQDYARLRHGSLLPWI